ncbi:mechanosensitive ion channel family protein [Parasedimentitalea psychrophila]|uniref:Small-conductance mechanosensitive channel n=1 Tax=Parasedimentitalea psychrophila TaxID=2997337 RepID=A0A9Y2P639_9RHOB|nr:mechanosensitive ion channel domain-containing protein [Parasedimentitalea psychrophila]WIY24270.1 mechanosensitive ion channel [Parasedimentitalea psychrophila]
MIKTKARNKWPHRIQKAMGLMLLVCALLPVQTSPALTQTAPATLPEQPADETYLAPVVIDGDTLFVVRGSSALPAVERAEKVQQRIIAAAERSDVKWVKIDILDNEFGQEIEVDGRMVTITTQADAEHEDLELEVLAGLQSEAIETAILTYRDNRSGAARVGSALAALGWTLGFAVITFAFVRKRKTLIAYAAGLIEKRSANLEQATKSLVRSNAIVAILSYLLNILLWIGYLTLFYYYLSFVLLAFAETQAFAELLLANVSRPMMSVLRGFVAYIPNLITLTIIAFMTRFAIQRIKLFFNNVENDTFDLGEFEKHWIAPTFFLSKMLVILLALVFAYPYIPGSDSRAFQGMTILAGIMLSLGSNTVVSNMMAGLFVIYRRSTNIGDRIQVGDKVGDVVEIKLMETLLKSVKNEMISIPNAQLLNSEVVNYSRQIDGKGLLVHTTVGIGYEEPPKKVIAMLIEAAHRTDGLKKRPTPFVLWTQLADYAINYEINAYTSRGSSLPQIKSDLHENIVDVFHENGTQIMTPSYIADPATPKIPDAPWNGELKVTENTKVRSGKKGAAE